jgi:hypothetical protein
MSWDIIVQDLPDVASVAEIPDGFEPGVIGTRTMLISKIKEAFPSADFSNPSWGLIETDTGSIEVNIGDDEQCDSIALHVRGGESSFPVVVTLLNTLGMRGIDCQTSEFFDPLTGEASFEKWRDYRDQVVSEYCARPSIWERFLGLFR